MILLSMVIKVYYQPLLKQTAKQLEVIPEAVLTEAFKLNGLEGR